MITSELKQQQQKEREFKTPDITTKNNRLFQYINRLFFLIHHHQQTEDQRFGSGQLQSVHLES